MKQRWISYLSAMPHSEDATAMRYALSYITAPTLKDWLTLILKSATNVTVELNAS